ncbi:MAG: hypothetical protein HY537_10560 [Deltaproteobacteria bacterium]|nr:hypothetical protein [Deltaproteobacteria bacterium]
MKQSAIGLVLIFTVFCHSLCAGSQTDKTDSEPTTWQTTDPENVRKELRDIRESVEPTTPDTEKSPTESLFEVLQAKDYLEFAQLDKIPTDLIRFDRNSGALLYLSQASPPYIFLFGTVKNGYELQIGVQKVPLTRDKFEVRFEVPLHASPTPVKLIGGGKIVEFRLLTHWKKIPPTIRFRVKEGNQVMESALGFTGGFKKAAFVQLYSRGTPVDILDLDSQRHAELTFRIQYSPDEPFDGWRLTIRDSQERLVGQLRRFGSPPQFVDWREVAQRVFARDSYTYRVDLYKDQKLYEGTPNRFEAIEGLSLLEHKYLPGVQLEPKADIGYYNYSNDMGDSYSNVFVGADATFSFSDTFLLKGTALSSLHSSDPANIFTFTRAGLGLRFHATGRNHMLGDPFIMRLDILLNQCGFTVNPFTSDIRRYVHQSVLLEPHVVLWAYHYFVPWVEFGYRLLGRVGGDQNRISFGLTYNFFVRPWSLKLGLGFAFDRLFKLDMDPTVRFSIFRTVISIAFQL